MKTPPYIVRLLRVLAVAAALVQFGAALMSKLPSFEKALAAGTAIVPGALIWALSSIVELLWRNLEALRRIMHAVERSSPPTVQDAFPYDDPRALEPEIYPYSRPDRA